MVEWLTALLRAISINAFAPELHTARLGSLPPLIGPSKDQMTLKLRKAA